MNQVDLSAIPELRPYVRGGKLVEVPRKRSRRLILLDELAQLFNPGQHYSEAEVNNRLRQVHPDYAALRRYLVDDGFLDRTAGEYWRSGGSDRSVVAAPKSYSVRSGAASLRELRGRRPPLPPLTPVLRSSRAALLFASLDQAAPTLDTVEPLVLVHALHHRVSKDVSRLGTDTRARIVSRQVPNRGKQLAEQTPVAVTHARRTHGYSTRPFIRARKPVANRFR